MNSTLQNDMFMCIFVLGDECTKECTTPFTIYDKPNEWYVTRMTATSHNRSC